MLYLLSPFSDIDSATELPSKKKNKREYEGEKTKNSKPNNPRGGIAATISNLCNGITEQLVQPRAVPMAIPFFLFFMYVRKETILKIIKKV